jgi:carbonic anhydrase/acetyltransferase-like protein (isoleucine patch superfamily)
MTHRFTKTAGVYLASSCTVLGDVVIGGESSVWFGAVIRGDVARITIGQRVNVQDLSMIHCDSGVPNTIEDDVTIGHAAIIHGKHVGRGSLIGMGAKLLSDTVIGEECLIGAGALVPPKTVIPPRSVVMGVPAKIVRPVNERDLEYMRWLAPHYVKLAQRHVDGEFLHPLSR